MDFMFLSKVRLHKISKLPYMKITLETVSYSNPQDRKILQACLSNWFSSPKELQFTDPRMSYPFDFRKWCSLSYKDGNSTSLIVKMDGWIVAYLSVKHTSESKHVHFFHLFVDKNHRNKGLARTILDAGVALAEELGASYITLNAVSKNKRAIGIYEISGFKQEGVTNSGSLILKKEIL